MADYAGVHRALGHLVALLALVGCDRPAEPLRPAPVGVALGLYPGARAEVGHSFPPPVHEIAALGARTAWLPVTWRQAELTAQRIERGRDTLPDAELEAVINAAHAAGMDVVICPLIEVDSPDPWAWRGRLSAETSRAGWWSSYGEMLEHYASIAERLGVSGLVVSDELNWLSRAPLAPHWRAVAARLRRTYGGELIAVVNHDVLRTAELPWDVFDRVGVSAYFPLASTNDATQAELDAGWIRAAATIEAFSARIGRRVFVAEVGYPSVDGGAVEPWRTPGRGDPLDLAEQAAAFRALERALPRMRSVEGVVIWAWLGPGGAEDRWYTPRDKPAEPVVRRILTRLASGGGRAPRTESLGPHRGIRSRGP